MVLNTTSQSCCFVFPPEINVLQAINNVLKERHEIESNYKNLALKFKEMQEEEALRRAKVCSVRVRAYRASAPPRKCFNERSILSGLQFDEARKKQLAELQAKGEALCREKAKLQHQIEHVTWHLEGCRRRRPCLARLPENCPLKGDAPSCLPHSPEKLKIMVRYWVYGCALARTERYRNDLSSLQGKHEKHRRSSGARDHGPAEEDSHRAG